MSVTDNRILHYIWLSNVLPAGNKCIKKLFSTFGNIDEIYEAEGSDYIRAGFSHEDTLRLSNKDLTIVEKQYEYCKREKIGFLCYDDPYYPERLKIINNPPCMFYYRGRLNLIDDFPCFAFVGTRKCTLEGFTYAYNTAYVAAAGGAVIVNGLADGIDGACISAALDANAYAIGVLGCGIDRIYPEKNRDLYYKLSASGLILTEFPPFTEPKGTNFPIRNRVISGLCLATAIFEADADRSGAMITARYALSQGRGLFAVPGTPEDRRYSGSLELIKDGANLLTEADDILLKYALMFPHRILVRKTPEVPQDFLQKAIDRCFDKKNGRKSVEKTSASSSKKTISHKTYSKNSIKEKSSSDMPIPVEHTQYQKNDKAPIVPKQQNADMSLLSVTEQQIAELFATHKELCADDIVEKGFKIDDVLSSITLLEVYGYIHALPGGRYRISE